MKVSKLFEILRFHIHDWEVIQEAVYYNSLAAKLGVPSQHKKRRCKKCGKIQKLDIHCLGLNPPTYTERWITLPKQKQNYESIW